MHTPPWTDEHSHAICAAEPDVPEASPDELDRTWSTVLRDLPTTVATSRRRTRALLVAGVVAASLAVGGVAAGSVWSAHTQMSASDDEDLRLGGPGERLDSAAPDYGDVIRSRTRDIPFPSDEARAVSRQALVADGRRDPTDHALVSTGAMRLWTAEAAVCSWANEWAAAVVSGDASARALATHVLSAAPSWRSVTDVDPEQTIEFRRVRVTDDQTGESAERKVVVDNTAAGYLPIVGRAAQGDSVDAMGSVLAYWGGNCVPDLFPDLPQALDFASRRPDLPETSR